MPTSSCGDHGSTAGPRWSTAGPVAPPGRRWVVGEESPSRCLGGAWPNPLADTGAAAVGAGEAVEAIVLAGGRGERLRSVVADRPKPLALVAGRPILEWILVSLRAQGVRSVLLATGYGGEMLEAYFGNGAALGLTIRYSREDRPLGTGGALRLAAEHSTASRLLVLNGDSYSRFDVAALTRRLDQSAAVAAMWVCWVPDTARYGGVQLAADHRVLAFTEKGTAGPGFVNAGVYLVTRTCVLGLPAGSVLSLERDILPGLAHSALVAVVGQGELLDIGTPESYASAGLVLHRLLAHRHAAWTDDQGIAAPAPADHCS